MKEPGTFVGIEGILFFLGLAEEEAKEVGRNQLGSWREPICQHKEFESNAQSHGESLRTMLAMSQGGPISLQIDFIIIQDYKKNNTKLRTFARVRV